MNQIGIPLVLAQQNQPRKLTSEEKAEVFGLFWKVGLTLLVIGGGCYAVYRVRQYLKDEGMLR